MYNKIENPLVVTAGFACPDLFSFLVTVPGVTLKTSFSLD